jgi:hypothetical protein
MSDTTQVAADAVTDTTAAAANPDATTATVPAVVEGQGQADADATKPEGDKPEDKEPVGAPEAYAPFEVPEGFTLEGERLEWAQAQFKELNLSQAQAQKLVAAYCQANGENLATQAAFLEQERAQRIETWGQQAKEVFGAKYDETLTLARAGVAAVNDPELLEVFNAEGWGNHPALIKAFAKLGELARGSGPKGLEGETARTEQPSDGDRMYAHATRPVKPARE